MWMSRREIDFIAIAIDVGIKVNRCKLSFTVKTKFTGNKEAIWFMAKLFHVINNVVNIVDHNNKKKTI